MKKAIVWSKPNCKYCVNAKSLLTNKGIAFEERSIGSDWSVDQLLEVAPLAKSVPQIFIDGKHIGGFSELETLFN